MTDCPACTEAMTNRWCGAYRASCLECSARALSHSQPFHFSVKDKAPTAEYKAALRSTFGDDWKQGHQRVTAWAERRAA